MSYQFEDESALEELLNQQLDRRKNQPAPSRTTTSAGSRPGTSAGGPKLSSSSSQFRPSTATKISSSNDKAPNTSSVKFEADAAPVESGAPKSKLSAWLGGGSGGGVGNIPSSASKSSRNDDREPSSYSNVQLAHERTREATTKTMINVNHNDNDDELAHLNSLLSPAQLQEMSKQRLIKLILEQIAPKLSQLGQVASKQSALEVDRLTKELQVERNRLQVIEMRHEEQLRLEQQRAVQISGQLEARLEASEREFAKTMDSQREHLAEIDEQYRKSLGALQESYERRLRDEKSRFDEILRGRDELHKLEMDSRLNVSQNLTKMDTIQAEWRQSLEGTISQLEGHFREVSGLLDKQTLQVKGTNSDLASKSQLLCEQYDKFDHCHQRLTSAAKQMDELLPQLVTTQNQGEALRAKTNELLAGLDKKLQLIQEREKALDGIRAELDGTGRELNTEKLKLTLNLNRCQMKEERLDELLKTSSECERKLAEERRALLEQQTQAQIKRVNLDERAADLKEQNYTLHLLRKRLTNQREEFIKAQVSFVEERKSVKGERSQMVAESRRLATLRIRVQRELDQLTRLQQSLVCSLCMGRLFGNTGGYGAKHDQQYQLSTSQLPTMRPPVNMLNLNRPSYGQNDDDVESGDGGGGQLLGQLTTATRNDDDDGKPDGHGEEADDGDEEANGVLVRKSFGKEKTMPNVEPNIRRMWPTVARNAAAAAVIGSDLDFELRQSELESGRLAVEAKYIQQLLLAG